MLLILRQGPHHNNLSPSEKQASLHLTKRDDIIIKPADKGGALLLYGRGPCTMPKHTGSYLMAGFTTRLTTMTMTMMLTLKHT